MTNQSNSDALNNEITVELHNVPKIKVRHFPKLVFMRFQMIIPQEYALQLIASALHTYVNDVRFQQMHTTMGLCKFVATYIQECYCISEDQSRIAYDAIEYFRERRAHRTYLSPYVGGRPNGFNKMRLDLAKWMLSQIVVDLSTIETSYRARAINVEEFKKELERRV